MAYLWVLIVAPVSSEDRNGTEIARVREALDESGLLQQAISAAAESMLALQALRHDPCANAAPAAWLGQACPKQFDLHLITVLFIMSVAEAAQRRLRSESLCFRR